MGDIFIPRDSNKMVLLPYWAANATIYQNVAIFPFTPDVLQHYQHAIDSFLRVVLKIGLHPEKSAIRSLQQGIGFLGFRVFYHHKLLKKANLLEMRRRMLLFEQCHKDGSMSYDEIYASMEGWLTYARHGHTYRLRSVFIREFEVCFQGRIASIEIDRWLKLSCCS